MHTLENRHLWVMLLGALSMSVSGKKKLNIGCGTDIRPGWVNLDSADISGVDVVHDIEKLPLPFEDNTFDEILCQDVLEHVEYIPVLQDLHRILKPDSEITIQVPHFTSRNNFIDPTHKKRFPSIHSISSLTALTGKSIDRTILSSHSSALCAGKSPLNSGRRCFLQSFRKMAREQKQTLARTL